VTNWKLSSQGTGALLNRLPIPHRFLRPVRKCSQEKIIRKVYRLVLSSLSFAFWMMHISPLWVIILHECITSAFGCKPRQVLSNSSENTAVAIFMVKWSEFWKPCIGNAVGGDTYSRLTNCPHYTSTLKMATVMFSETLDLIQHSTRLTPEVTHCTPAAKT
jgi:hypothetical protein